MILFLLLSRVVTPTLVQKTGARVGYLRPDVEGILSLNSTVGLKQLSRMRMDLYHTRIAFL
jgi:hypothetical protein